MDEKKKKQQIIHKHDVDLKIRLISFSRAIATVLIQNLLMSAQRTDAEAVAAGGGKRQERLHVLVIRPKTTTTTITKKNRLRMRRNTVFSNQVTSRLV